MCDGPRTKLPNRAVSLPQKPQQTRKTSNANTNRPQRKCQASIVPPLSALYHIKAKAKTSVQWNRRVGRSHTLIFCFIVFCFRVNEVR